MCLGVVWQALEHDWMQGKGTGSTVLAMKDNLVAAQERERQRQRQRSRERETDRDREIWSQARARDTMCDTIKP
jgi:hypothetical protein